MIVRPIDENGDMMPIAYASQMLEGGEAVAQVARQRLELYYGEWWEDETAGFRIPEFLASGVRKENLELMEKYISSYVKRTEGVDNISDTSVTYLNREMTYSGVIHTEGEANRVEVGLSGLLSSEY